ncbi:hypothetical protein PG987_014019 [Apiospora arundinis]
MSPTLEVDLHEWCPEFELDKNHFQGDNQIYVKTFSPNFNSQTDVMVVFTNADDPDQMPNEETETVLRFCRKRFKSYRQVPEAGDAPDSTERALLLDKTGLRGNISEDMTADAPEAERRLVFIVNLDEWIVWSLAATVSPIQATAVRSFISNHIAFKATLDVYIPPDGPRTFAMSFHLPFYVLRDTSKGARFHDPRGLRNSQDVGFMRTPSERSDEPSLSCEFIYQAGVSCLVTGQNFRFWTAYMFLDDYDESEEGEILEDYEAHRESLEEARITLDPFTGKPIAWKLMTPREFFLRVLEVRSGQAWREWRYTVSHILSYFGNTRDVYVQHLYEPGDEGRSKRKAYFVWINSVIKLLAKLRRSLGECTRAWASFTAPAGELCYFRAPAKQWDTMRTHKLQLVNIMKSFNHMSDLLRELEIVDGELKSTVNEVRIYPSTFGPADT